MYAEMYVYANGGIKYFNCQPKDGITKLDAMSIIIRNNN